MKQIITIILSIIFHTSSLGQPYEGNENEKYIYWQPSLKLKSKDFMAAADTSLLGKYKDFDFKSVAAIGLHKILDVPKKRRDRRRKPERVYLAPAFQKTKSFTLTEDSLEIVKQQFYFDLTELSARKIRKELDSLKAFTNNAYGIAYIMLNTITKKIRDQESEINYAYTLDIFKDKKNNAFQEWRSFMDEELRKLENYATTPEECQRFLIGEPLEPGYEQSKTIMGVKK